jgi:hypothetical protein
MELALSHNKEELHPLLLCGVKRPKQVIELARDKQFGSTPGSIERDSMGEY